MEEPFISIAKELLLAARPKKGLKFLFLQKKRCNLDEPNTGGFRPVT